jgi:hypothetical protein
MDVSLIAESNQLDCKRDVQRDVTLDIFSATGTFVSEIIRFYWGGQQACPNVDLF